MSTLGAGGRSLARAGDAVDHRPTEHGVESMPGCVTGPATGGPVDQLLPPSIDFDISSKALRGPDDEPAHAEHVHDAVAVGPDGAPDGRVPLTVVRCRRDLLLRPGVPAVV